MVSKWDPAVYSDIAILMWAY